MNAQKVLTAESHKIVIGGMEFEVKPLSVRQVLRIIKFLSGLQDKIKPGTSVISMLSAADDKLPELLGLMLGQEISAEQTDSISLVEMSRLAVVISEVNDLPEVLRNFQVAAASLNLQKQSAAQK